MLKKEDIEHLATLARLAISEEEKELFVTQLDSVLGYVSEISAIATTHATPTAGMLRNVLREDAHPNQGGTFTEAILNNAPHREGHYVKVEQIF